MSIILFFVFIVFSFLSPIKTNSSPFTLPSDVAALAAFRASILPSSIKPWSCLASWNFTSDPCHPSHPTHFTCGLICFSPSPSPSSPSRIAAITLDAAGYSAVTLSPSLANLTNLLHLNLFDNSFHGPIPSSLFPSLSSLQTLVLKSNSFSGPIPSSLSTLPNLQIVDLSNNLLTGPIPQFPPSSLPSLVTLDLSYNSLSGALPGTLPTSLVELTLRGNLISGGLSKPTFQAMRFLEVVELSVNRMEGRIEGWFFQLPSLQQVDLANNSFTSLEAWKWKVNGGGGDRLVAVDVSFNRIRGELPAELAGYPVMAAVSARYNSLKGGIPWEYGKMRRLFLDGNFLNGEVPEGVLYSKGEMMGSLGDNCLTSCPRSVAMCSTAAQKPDWVCKQVYGVRRRPHNPSPSP